MTIPQYKLDAAWTAYIKGNPLRAPDKISEGYARDMIREILEAAAAAVPCPDELWAWCETCQRSYAPRSSHASDPSLPKHKRSGKERRVRQNDLRMVGDKIHAQRGDALYPINRSGDDRRYQPAPPRFVRGSGCVVVDEGRKEERRNPTLSGAIQYFSYGNKDRRVHIDTTRDRRKPRG